MIERSVSEDGAGQRLDKFLRRLLADVPLSHLYKLLRTRQVRVNGRRAKGDLVLAEGDRVVVRGDPEALLAKRPEARPPPDSAAFRARILHEDELLLAWDKPSGVAVHPGSGIDEPTLVDLARAYLPVAPDGEFQPSPAHRLDRETSGVVLVAKSRRAMVRLTEIFTEGLAEKRYIALAKGRLSHPEGTIDLPLAEHEQSRASKEARGVKLQAALTHYRTLAAGLQVTLLECRIETGRTHQIRRHLAAIGHPVVGDKRHGDFAFNRQIRAQAGLRRMFLHAASLSLPHPGTGRILRLRSPLPPDLAEPLARLGVASPKDLHQADER